MGDGIYQIFGIRTSTMTLHEQVEKHILDAMDHIDQAARIAEHIDDDDMTMKDYEQVMAAFSEAKAWLKKPLNKHFDRSAHQRQILESKSEKP